MTPVYLFVWSYTYLCIYRRSLQCLGIIPASQRHLAALRLTAPTMHQRACDHVLVAQLKGFTFEPTSRVSWRESISVCVCVVGSDLWMQKLFVCFLNHVVCKRQVISPSTGLFCLPCRHVVIKDICTRLIIFHVTFQIGYLCKILCSIHFLCILNICNLFLILTSFKIFVIHSQYCNYIQNICSQYF